MFVIRRISLNRGSFYCNLRRVEENRSSVILRSIIEVRSIEAHCSQLDSFCDMQ